MSEQSPDSSRNNENRTPVEGNLIWPRLLVALGVCAAILIAGVMLERLG